MDNNYILISVHENKLLATLFQVGEEVSQRVFDTIYEDLFVTDVNKKAWKLGKRYYDAYGRMDGEKLIAAKGNNNSPQELKAIGDDNAVWMALYDASKMRQCDMLVTEAVRYLRSEWYNRKKLSILADLSTFAEGGLVEWDELTTKLENTLKQLKTGGSDSFESYLDNDLQTILQEHRKPVADIPTQYAFYHRGDKAEPIRFNLPSGALTVVGGVMNHGKSKVLQSLALDTIENTDKDVLYLTYEESKRDVYDQFLNAYVNIDLSANNRRTIKSYLHDGSRKYFSKDVRVSEDFHTFQFLEKKFNEEIYNKRLILVEPQDNYLSTLIGIVRSAVRKRNVGAVFIDYIQMLYLENKGKMQARTDEICRILVDIEALAKQYDIPIVLAAQLRRESSDSPLTIDNQSFADSDWIGRKPHSILLLWSNQKTCFNDPTGAKAKAVEKELPDLHLGDGGKMYLKVTKSREIPTGIECILPINGNTGRLDGNLPDSLMEDEERQRLEDRLHREKEELNEFINQQPFDHV